MSVIPVDSLKGPPRNRNFDCLIMKEMTNLPQLDSFLRKIGFFSCSGYLFLVLLASTDHSIFKISLKYISLNVR